jgi:hypothetical protein
MSPICGAATQGKYRNEGNRSYFGFEPAGGSAETLASVQNPRTTAGGHSCNKAGDDSGRSLAFEVGHEVGLTDARPHRAYGFVRGVG